MRVTPSAIPLLSQALRNAHAYSSSAKRAATARVGMVRLLPGPKQHMQGIADDLRNRAIMGEHDIGHAGQIVVEQRAKRAPVRASRPGR